MELKNTQNQCSLQVFLIVSVVLLDFTAQTTLLMQSQSLKLVLPVFTARGDPQVPQEQLLAVLDTTVPLDPQQWSHVILEIIVERLDFQQLQVYAQLGTIVIRDQVCPIQQMEQEETCVHMEAIVLPDLPVQLLANQDFT